MERRKIGIVFMLIITSGAAAQNAHVLDYIKQTWGVLARSNRDLLKGAIDPKHPPLANGRWPVYVANQSAIALADHDLGAEMRPEDFAKIEVRALPSSLIEIKEHGLLYLPRPYVVPGGRFNEMYGWDSYFIQIGLLRDGEETLAKDMADNFLYQIRNYGKILNANRTYYLTRSQPPFLTQMVLAVYEKTHDRDWLRDALPEIEAYYRYWTAPPHLVEATGLSRYYDSGEGPAPEVLTGEKDSHDQTIYDLARAFYRTHSPAAYDKRLFYDRERDRLTELFYKGDRSMRESGFDPSSRFGPFNVDIIRYNPVCLNTLLYFMEMQTGEIHELLGHPADAEVWRERAKVRSQAMNRYLWDTRDGLYYDYNFATRRVRRYAFLSTFYPLWAGISSREQAARVVHNLSKFERTGGLQTSATVSGDQWDAPFGWAPLQWIAIQGLRRYGYDAEADRIAQAFLTMTAKEYRRTGAFAEKYDVVRGTTDLLGEIKFGYHSNEAGFGWTNAVFTALLDQMPAQKREAILRLSDGQ